MRNDKRHVTDAPSLWWVWPIACSVWIGVFIDGWFAQPSVRNRLYNTIAPIFEGMLLPALTLLLVWCVFTPARFAYRLQAVLIVVLLSVPIAYAAHQRPGQPLLTIREFLQYYLDRYYLIEIKGLPFFEAGLAIAMAAVCLLLLNRFFVRIVFQRLPREPQSSGKNRRESSSETSRVTEHSAVSEARITQQTNGLLCGIVVILILGAAWQLNSGQVAELPTILRTGCLMGFSVYLWVWVASESFRPWLAFAILMLGTTGLACLPQIGQLTRTPVRSMLAAEYLILCSSVLASTALAALTLALLARAHQMPRRGKMPPFGTDVPAGVSALSTKSALPPKSASGIGFWAGGLLLWGLSLGIAVWVPLNMDAQDFTNEERLSVRDGWLAARFLEKTFRDRSQFNISRDPTSGQPTVHLKVPLLDESWRETVELVESRAGEGDLCSLEIESPVNDFGWLESLLRQGIAVTCSLDGQGHEIPASLITTPGLQLRRISNTQLTVPFWTLLKSAHPQLVEIVGCRLPDGFPNPASGSWPQEVTFLRDCEVSNNLLAAMTPITGWPAIGVTLFEPRFQQPIRGLTFAEFVYNGEILGAPPLTSPVEDGFPALFVPTLVSEEVSRWSFSTRPLLLDSGILSEVIAQPVSVPRHLGFDSAGRLVELGVVPNRDCPAAIPWATLPDVEHLYVNLVDSSYDARRSPEDVFRGEEIGFQVAAFPQLTRATIYTHQVFYRSQTVNSQIHHSPGYRDIRHETFLRELLQHPGLIEVTVESTLAPAIWDVLADGEYIERLVIWGGRDPHLPWLDKLDRFARLKEIVVMEQLGTQVRQARWLAMAAYRLQQNLEDADVAPPASEDDMALQAANARQRQRLLAELPRVQGLLAELEREPQLDLLEGKDLDDALEKSNQRLRQGWTLLFHAIVPGLRVEVVPAPHAGPNLRWPSSARGLP